MTTNHPANGPVSLDRLHQISEILSKAAAQSDGGNLGYAMADAVKVIYSAIASFDAEPVLYAAEETLAYAKAGELHLKCLSQPMGDAMIPLYTVPPAPVAMKDHQIRELVNDLRDIAIEYHGTQQLRERIARTVRAAMLQAGNSPVTPDGWIPVSERMPEGMTDVHISNGLDVGQGWWDGDTWQTQHDYYSVPGDVTHWMPLPAAPQQEVKNV
ncbi:hypothetical protein BEH71_10295 [Citrobacter freundii]|uniref:DUF551 domain-containing protein n=1 Tax=Citrobacter freundii TaxID=546 RepID=UPI000916A603|nr:DUF551 domain-containing protein [Citrobacter freundii]OIZ54277.1 hypothetical protein BEH71_10295 [Citrobacter freundii]